MSFEANLRQLRKSRKLTQDQMADLVGLHTASIKTYETGRARPSLETFKKIIVACDITADELLFDKHERAPSPDLKLAFQAVQILLGNHNIKSTGHCSDIKIDNA
ncbi:helix-turn-helix transcriptional regulator [uncultured Oceanicoccus sp.]|uniref:helix-turn-helix domain-containing protein n=1 Tax=uncultured Oceanicoccus sp. TaxID=1706381 RepID=UPI0030DC88B0